MSLGQNISGLRAKRGLSQGDVAEALDVSRQSVSKWETDGAVPELDKLMRLGELFGVTLDELVRGAPTTPTPDTGASAPAETPRAPARHSTAGAVLLCLGAFLIVLFFALGGGLSGVLFAAPFLLCGLICMTARRRAGLWCAWAAYLSVELYLRLATGITWAIVLQTHVFRPEWNYARLAIGWGELLAMAVLLACTLRAYRALTLAPARGRLAALLGGWALLLALGYGQGRLSAALFERGAAGAALTLLHTAGDWLRLALFAALLIASLAIWRGARRR